VVVFYELYCQFGLLTDDPIYKVKLLTQLQLVTETGALLARLSLA